MWTFYMLGRENYATLHGPNLKYLKYFCVFYVQSLTTGKDARDGELVMSLVRELKNFGPWWKKKTAKHLLFLREDKRSILVTFWFYNVKFDSLLWMYTGLCIETYGKDKILWKWQTAFLKIYMLVVLWLYFYKIMTRCQCLKSILFWGMIFSDSLLERII